MSTQQRSYSAFFTNKKEERKKRKERLVRHGGCASSKPFPAKGKARPESAGGQDPLDDHQFSFSGYERSPCPDMITNACTRITAAPQYV
jgi:hypothetical protein